MPRSISWRSATAWRSSPPSAVAGTGPDRLARCPRAGGSAGWHRRLWLIDHGASLYVHHSAGWEVGSSRSADPFPLIKDHVLRKHAGMVGAVDQSMTDALTPSAIDGIVSWIPEAWLATGEPGREAEPQRAAYARYLVERLAAPRAFVEEASRGR